MRLAGVIALVTGLLLVTMPSASADVWGARKWTATNLTYPNECLHIGLHISTGPIPDKHSVESVNTCGTNLVVDIQLTEYDSSTGLAVVNCFSSVTNRAQCERQHAHSSSQYWFWEATMHSTESFKSCSEFNAAYGSCWTSRD